jgi:hypothetical protein
MMTTKAIKINKDLREVSPKAFEVSPDAESSLIREISPKNKIQIKTQKLESNADNSSAISGTSPMLKLPASF